MHHLDDIRRVGARLEQPRVDRGGERGDDLLVLVRVLRRANIDHERAEGEETKLDNEGVETQVKRAQT